MGTYTDISKAQEKLQNYEDRENGITTKKPKKTKGQKKVKKDKKQIQMEEKKAAKKAAKKQEKQAFIDSAIDIYMIKLAELSGLSFDDAAEK